MNRRSNKNVKKNFTNGCLTMRKPNRLRYSRFPVFRICNRFMRIRIRLSAYRYLNPGYYILILRYLY